MKTGAAEPTWRQSKIINRQREHSQKHQDGGTGREGGEVKDWILDIYNTSVLPDLFRF